MEAKCLQKKKKGQLKEGCIFFSFKYYTFESMMDNVKVFPFIQNSKMLFAGDINGCCSLSLSDGE